MRVAESAAIGNNPAVQPSGLVLALASDGLTIVVFGTVAFSLLMSIAILLTRGGGGGSMYDQIGTGGISREADAGGGAPMPGSAAERAEQEQEIRQMLTARSERRVRRGEEALDIDAEVARLLALEPASHSHDASLVEEVRQLVLARNARRVRQGMEPLDVEAEVTRTLTELDP
jgi:hypothetical protein